MPKRSLSKKRPRKAAASHAPVVPRFMSVAVVVSDRSKSVAWYTEKFGLDHVDDMDHWQTVGHKGSGGLLHLCQVSEYDKTAAMEPGNSGIAFQITGDFVSGCRDLEARGVKFSTPPTKFDWGWSAAVLDPDGNELYLVPAG
jgi:predicted enzyme related to lactoylglutathione lyase